MFRFAILTLRGLYSFVTREQFFQIVSDLGKNPLLHDVLEKAETFEFREAGPDATVADFELWHKELLTYRDRVQRHHSGFVTSDGELFTYEFDACKCEKFLWDENARLDAQDWLSCETGTEEHYSELEHQDAEQEYYYQTKD